MSIENSAVVSLYVVKNGNGGFFAGFNSAENKASFVSDPLSAKKFTNKYDVKLRPDEALVELTVDLSKVNVAISEPFRPHRRVQRVTER